MSEHELAKRRPAFILAAGKLRAKKNVVLSSRHVERAGWGVAESLARWKWRGHGSRGLGSSKVLPSIHYEPQPTGRVQTQGSVPPRQPSPVSGVKKTGFGVRTAGK